MKIKKRIIITWHSEIMCMNWRILPATLFNSLKEHSLKNPHQIAYRYPGLQRSGTSRYNKANRTSQADTKQDTIYTNRSYAKKKLTYDGGIRQLREELAPAAADAEAEEEGLVRGLGIARSRIHVMQQWRAWTQTTTRRVKNVVRENNYLTYQYIGYTIQINLLFPFTF